MNAIGLLGPRRPKTWLRADLTGQPIQLSNPMVDEFFNAAAFSVPVPGTFGDSPRNVIIGPGARQLNGTLVRDVRLTGNRVLTLQVNATNLLNNVDFANPTVNLGGNAAAFGKISGVVNNPRIVQMALRFDF